MAELSPVDWAKRPIQKYADFSGRAPRAEYWWYTLAVVVVAIVVSIVEGIVGLSGAIGGVYGPLSLLLVLALLVPGIAVGVRRLHDTNRSGWWMLLLVPYALVIIMTLTAVASGSMAVLAGAGMLGIVGLICAIALLVFMVLPGTKGPNSYGADPYAADVEQVFA